MIKHKIVLGVTQTDTQACTEKEGMATSKSRLLAIQQNISIQAFPVEIMFQSFHFPPLEASEQLHQHQATAPSSSVGTI